ncbi:MAG: DUF423 domain-containing protein, partial [Bacteroidota bacterium]
MRKNFIRIGAISMAIAVILGAFGAHGLKEIISVESMKTFETGARYHIYHSLAILLIGILLYDRKTRLMLIAGWLFVIGIIFFSGSLYLLSMAEVENLPVNILGPITPIGGVILILGWVLLAASTFQDN